MVDTQDLGSGEIPGVFRSLQPHIERILGDEELAAAEVHITCRTLTPEEALGNPGRDDFPLQKGKERLMQADIGFCSGQAFTDRPGNISGTVEKILKLSPDNNFHRAAIVATLNALLRSRGELEGTVHCKDDGPRLCGLDLVEKISGLFGDPKVVMVGLQPAMAEALSLRFALRIVDLDRENEGKEFNHSGVETGPYSIKELEKWGDLFLVTGSTIVNGTIDQFLDTSNPVLFFGTTIAAPAALLNLKRFCSRSS